MDTPSNSNPLSTRLVSLSVIAAVVVSQVVNVLFEHISPWPMPCCRQQWLLTTLPANVGLACMLEEITTSILAVESYGDSATVSFGLSVLSLLLTIIKDQMLVNNAILLYRGCYVFFLSWTMLSTMLLLRTVPGFKKIIEDVPRRLQSTTNTLYGSLYDPQPAYSSRSGISTTQQHRPCCLPHN